MKHGKLFLLFFVILFSLYSCNSGNKANLDVPEWYLNPPENPDYIYGIGIAKAESDGEAILLAEDRARVNIAEQISIIFYNTIKKYSDNDGNISVDYDDIAITEKNDYGESRTNAHIYMSDVILREKTKNGTWYCLLSVSKYQIQDQNSRLELIDDNFINILHLNAAELSGMEIKKQEVDRNGEIITVFQKNTSSIPDWVFNPVKIQQEGILYGLGAAKLDNDNDSIELAKERARHSLAHSLDVEVKNSYFYYNNYAEDNTSVTSIFDHSVFITQLSLYTKSKDGTWWVLLQSPRSMYRLKNMRSPIDIGEALRKIDEAFDQMEMEKK